MLEKLCAHRMLVWKMGFNSIAKGDDLGYIFVIMCICCSVPNNGNYLEQQEKNDNDWKCKARLLCDPQSNTLYKCSSSVILTFILSSERHPYAPLSQESRSGLSLTVHLMSALTSFLQQMFSMGDLLLSAVGTLVAIRWVTVLSGI